MASSTTTAALRAQGISVELDRSVRIAAVRHFDRDAIAPLLHAVLGEGPPGPHRLVRGAHGGKEPFILLWRAPDETWLLAASAAPIDALVAVCAAREDACVVEQTGGILALHAAGARTHDLLQRLGSSASIPRAGEARSGRFADVTVTVLGLGADEALLLVDRAYAEHLLAWIRETLADFA